MATAKATTNHDEIRKWVEARKGRPARVKATGRGKDPGILRIDFPGFSGEDTLEEIEWDEFFEWFDRNNLALLLSSERGNRFNKLVARTSAKKASSSKKSTGAKKSSSTKSSSGRGTKSSSKKASSAKKSSAKKASSTGSKKSSGSTKKAAASSSKKSSSSTKKASSAKKAAPSKKAASSKKSSSKKSTKKSSSTTRRLVASKTPSRKASSKKATTGSSRTTTDHDEIRKWVESRGGFPATVAGTETREDEAGVLRIDYPGFTGAGTLERIEWDDWFEKFDEEDLAFVYQNKRNSRFSKLVRR